VVYSVLTHPYIVNITWFWLHILVLPNHLQVNIHYMEVNSVCTYIMESHCVYIKSYPFKILILSLKSIDRTNFKNIYKYSYQCKRTLIVKIMSVYIHINLI